MNTNNNLEFLNEYPFKKLSNLLHGIIPPNTSENIILSLGEPAHLPPKFFKKIINKNYSGWSKYPPTLGLENLNIACLNWLKRRYNLPNNLLNVKKNILQVAGTREGLFNIALAINNRNNCALKPITLMPDPFYQVYAGAAIMSGSKPIPVPSLEKNKFIPDFESIDNELIKRTSLIYICSPSNPEGKALSLNEWVSLIKFSKKINAVLVADECYTEIYVGSPPIGILEACKQLGNKLDNIIAFHSLSKRSNLPGIRSGFAVGDHKIIEAYKKLRQYCAGQTPIPIQEAACELWNDDKHVLENRKAYKKKFKIAQNIFKNNKNFYIPDGGFYIWLKVKNDEAFTKRLWKEYGVKVMPGSYLAKSSFSKSYIRIALVAHEKKISKALKYILKLLEKEF